MPSRKPNQSRGYKQANGIQSKQEELIKKFYPTLDFKPSGIPYVMNHTYLPDLRLGVDQETGKTVYLELKEWMLLKDVAKYQAVLKSNPHIILAFLIYDAPSQVFIRLGGTAGTWVAQGYTTIPTEWLKRVRKPAPQDTLTNDYRPSTKDLGGRE